MIYLFTAMYCEAHPLIQQYQLKKETTQTHFQVFSNESNHMRLVITGTGMIAAAAAVSSVCTKYPPEDYDFLVNIGICAGTSKKKDLFLCNKITEQTTGKTFYPDILYQHPFCEARVITGAKPFQKDDLEKSKETCLYDMEASAIYQSGSYFFGPHQMFFLKTISDCGDFENVTPNQVQCQIAAHMDRMIEFCDQLNKIRKMQETVWAFSNENPETSKTGELSSDSMNQTKYTLRASQYDTLLRSGLLRYQQSDNKTNTTYAGIITDTLCKDLHCSHVMAASVRQHIRYCILSGIDYQTIINEMYNEQKLPCKDKREGKLRLEELQKRLL